MLVLCRCRVLCLVDVMCCCCFADLALLHCFASARQLQNHHSGLAQKQDRCRWCEVACWCCAGAVCCALLMLCAVDVSLILLCCIVLHQHANCKITNLYLDSSNIGADGALAIANAIAVCVLLPSACCARCLFQLSLCSAIPQSRPSTGITSWPLSSRALSLPSCATLGARRSC